MLKKVPRSFFGRGDRFQERTKVVVQMRTGTANVLLPITAALLPLIKLVDKGRERLLLIPFHVSFFEG